MSEECESSFYAQLLQFIHADTEKRTREGGYDRERDVQLFSYTRLLTQTLNLKEEKPSAAIEDILRSYRYLFEERGPLHIETSLLEAFSPQEYRLKIYRGLPRLYRKDNPAISQIKRNFTHLPSLKAVCLEKHLLALYPWNHSNCRGSVCVFNWVISDGWGDWIAASEIADLLKTSFPDLSVTCISLIPKQMGGLPSFEKKQFTQMIVPYERACSVDDIPEQVWHCLHSADLVVSFPTFYPQTDLLLKRLKRRTDNPRWMNIGEYGYVESSWFHPRSSGRSMGLHFLEKGVLIRKSCDISFVQLENERLKLVLFKTATPSLFEIECYLDRTALYLAYLSTPIGAAVYLHALLESRKFDPKPIDICTPDIAWLIAYIEMQKREGRPLLQADFGVKEVEVDFQARVHRIRLGESGKSLRIVCPGALSNADFRLLIRMSEEFVGVRGNQSFSEAVSANRLFFYDGPTHARYFVKDLIALAENRLHFSKGARTLFRCIGKTFLHTLPVEEGEWVDETYFQEREPWMQIALTLGSVLADPQTIAGCKQLNQMIAKEHAFSDWLLSSICREFVHRKDPEFEGFERGQIELFARGHQPIADCLSSIQNALYHSQKINA